MILIITNGTIEDRKENMVVLSPLYGHNIYNISEYAADAEFENIECHTVNQIRIEMLGQVLDNYVGKLRKNGRICFYGIDLYLLAKKIYNREINLLEINSALFGGTVAHEQNQSLIGINDLVQHLEDKGLKITSKSFDGIEYRLEAMRESV